MNNEYLLLTGALRVFDDFSQSDCGNYVIKHDTQNPQFATLLNSYPIKEVAGEGGDFSKVINLLHWVHDNVLHSEGGGEVDIAKDSLSILSYCYGKGQVPGIFCFHIAVVFTECCLATGLIARTIHGKPYNPYDMDTHVVSMVYISEMKKWVLFDPTNNAYFTDENNIPLSPLEARYLLGRDNVNACGIHKDNLDRYKQYMAKNLFYIKFWAVNTYGTDLVENQAFYFLAPSGFNVKSREIASCEYIIKISPVEYRKGWEDYLNEVKNLNVIRVSEEQFLQIA